MNKIVSFTLVMGLLFGSINGCNAQGITSKVTHNLEKVIKLIRETPGVLSHSITSMFTKKNTLIVSGMGVASIALASVWCASIKAHTKSWTAIIDAAKEYTKYLDDQTGIPKTTMYMYKGMANPKWRKAGQIKKDYNEVCKYLLKTRNKTDKGKFINHANEAIENEKAVLVNVLGGLNNCIQECSLLPTISISSDDEPSYLKTLIERTKNRCLARKKKLEKNQRNTLVFEDFSCEDNFIDLPEYVVKAINNEVNDQSSISILKPHQLLRYWVFPFESEAIAQAWKIYQLIQRLEALQFCLSQMLNQLNGFDPEVVKNAQIN